MGRRFPPAGVLIYIVFEGYPLFQRMKLGMSLGDAAFDPGFLECLFVSKSVDRC